jgi:AraC family transcriptional regulator
MEYRIENLDFEFNIVGVKSYIERAHAFDEVPRLWHEAQEKGLINQLIDMAWEEPKCKLESLLGVSGQSATIESDTFEYMIGVRYDRTMPENMEIITIPKATWAVFNNNGHAVWSRIYEEWLPASGYKLENIPVIECFYPPGRETEKEIWVPVKSEVL